LIYISQIKVMTCANFVIPAVEPGIF